MKNFDALDRAAVALSTIFRAIGPCNWKRNVIRRPSLSRLRSSRVTLTSYPPVSAWKATQSGVIGRRHTDSSSSRMNRIASPTT